MLKFFTLFFIVTSFLYAIDRVEIYATTIESKDNIIKADGEVIVIYKDYFLTAKSAIYDKNSGELELFGNIHANQGDNYKLLGESAKLNIAKKERSFKPFYMLEKQSEVWISADEGCAVDKELEIKSGVMSGCDPHDPLWQMQFSYSDYNTDSKWLNIYNARIYIYDIPVLYIPYFGYSLDRSRRTGVLTPTIGMSDIEGFYYEQPIYIAEQDWWDLELKPQIRTKRGQGIYSNFRFVDSKISQGELKLGYFREKSSYYSKQKLANKSHYGYNFKYDNVDVINQWLSTSLSGQSGLYIDIKNMNDVDYINLSSNDTTSSATSKQLLSRANLFYNTDDNYFATYFKYYKDLAKVSNSDTLQKLPTFQYHHYLKTLFSDHVVYNLDMKSDNIYRQEGQSVIQTDLNIPVTLHGNFFDEYLNLAYKANIYAQYSNFSKEIESEYEPDDGYFARNYHTVTASTQVSRAFDKFTHVMNFGSMYSVGGYESKNGFYEENEEFCSDPENKNEPRCEFHNITDIEENLQLDFIHYLYSDSGKQILYQRLAQSISYEKTQDRVGELEHELDYQISKNIKLYNNMFYNYDEKKLAKVLNKVSFRAGGFNVALSHYYKNTFLDRTSTYSPYTSYITSSASYTYDSHYSYKVKYNYDLETNLKKSAEVGFMYKKRCWDFGMRYLENNRPILTADGSTSMYDRYLYFTLNLKPIISSQGGSLYDWKLPGTTQGI